MLLKNRSNFCSVAACVAVAFGAMFAKPIAVDAATAARAFDFEAHRAGGVPASAEKFFTVVLHDDATADDARIVGDYFRGFGLTVTNVRNALLLVHGTYGEAAAAAHTSFAVFTLGKGGSFVHADGESYPQPIASRIVGTTIDDGPSAHSNALILPGSGYTPSEIAQFYTYPSKLTGAGANVAIVGCATIAPSDVSTFEADYGLPANAVHIVNVDGGTVTTDFEPTLDVERVIANTPAAGVYLYVVPNDCSFAHLANGFGAVFRDLAAKHYVAVSTSYSASEDSYVRYQAKGTLYAEDAILAKIAKTQVPIFCDSGDGGAYPPSFDLFSAGELTVEYPASSTHCLGVGATSAIPVSATNATRAFELAAGISGGGLSQFFKLPSFQHGVAGTLSSARNVPDLAWDGDLNTGPNVIYNATSYFAGGTSVGTPSWAGILALVAQSRTAAGKGRLQDPQAAIYGLRGKGTLYTIVSGCNGYYCAGTAVYNDVTGLGTPDVSLLVTALDAAR
jgi:kumamolisin